MRIAQIAPPWITVPPSGYGGTEWVVQQLCDGLAARGHEVVLYASGDSRTAADLRWLDSAFAYAKSEHAKGVVIFEQADMWDLDGKTASHIANYESFIANIARNTLAFGKPVLLFNGDSHTYRSDNPLSSTAPCVTESPSGEVACTENLGLHPQFYEVPNFHRVVVHGSTSPLEWLKLTVNADRHAPASANAFGPFSWSRQNTGLVGNS